MSVSQINRVRAALGISNHPKNREQEKKPQKSSLLQFRQSGRKGQGACCYWQQFTKRVSSLP